MRLRTLVQQLASAPPCLITRRWSGRARRSRPNARRSGTPSETIEAPVVVLAAGGGLRAVGTLAGLALPAQPVRHQLLITEPIEGVAAHHAICRVREERIYVRPSGGGLLLGGYEDEPLVLAASDLTPSFSIEGLELDPEVLHALIGRVARIFPDLVASRPTGRPRRCADDDA